MSSFSVGFHSEGPIEVLALKGELDAHTASELEAAFQRCRDDERVHILVDGTELDYISSAGLGVFMAYVEEIREQGGDIKITSLKPKVYDVFDLLGFHRLFDITETRDDAIEQFETPDPSAEAPPHS